MRLIKLGQGDYTRETDGDESFTAWAWVGVGLLVLLVVLVLVE